jgi:hypothetical protein
MYEAFKDPELKPTNHLVPDFAKEYAHLKSELPLLSKLFRSKYKLGIVNPCLLSETIGCPDVAKLLKAELVLDKWLCRVLGGSVRNDLIELVCPNCLYPALVDHDGEGEEIRKTCSRCGVELDDDGVDGFNQDLERDVTYAPTSHLSWTNGHGGTLNMKRDGHKLLHDASVPFDEFKVAEPEIAEALLDSLFVAVGDFTYHFVAQKNVVRKVPVRDFYSAVLNLFYQFDLPLRKYNLTLASNSQNELTKALTYGMELCLRFGINSKATDQAFYNTLGNDVRDMKRVLKLLRRHISERVAVETIFYLCLLRFGRVRQAEIVRAELRVNEDLVNLLADFKAFKQGHEKPNGSGAVLNCVEEFSKQRLAEKQ